MNKVLLTRERNNPLLNGALPFVSMAAGIFMAFRTSSKPGFAIAFGAFAFFSFASGILFWRARNIITQRNDTLIFQGFFRKLLLPAKQVIGIQTETEVFSSYKLRVKTADTIYVLSIPEPNGAEWSQLRKHLDKHKPFPYHLN